MDFDVLKKVLFFLSIPAVAGIIVLAASGNYSGLEGISLDMDINIEIIY